MSVSGLLNTCLHYYAHHNAHWIICAQRVNQVYKMRSPSVVLMLDQRRRRWPSIETTLGRRSMYAEKSIDYLRELMTSLTFSDPV